MLRWFVAQEPGAAAALRWLERFTADADALVAPDLLRFEILGGLARLQRDRDVGWAERAFDRFERLGMRLLPTDIAVARRALELSRALAIGGYDAVYLALAESLEISWLTADEKASKRLRGDPRVASLFA